MLGDIRKSVINKRKMFASDAGRYEGASRAAVKNAAKLIGALGVRSVMLYLPIGGEADITGIMALPLSFYIPVTEGVTIRPAHYTADTSLIRGEFGVNVPAEPQFVDKDLVDLVLVPAVAVDKEKNRMGYGKGCYDRFLADMDCVKAAVAFDFQIVEKLDPLPHDIKMDYIITESGYF